MQPYNLQVNIGPVQWKQIYDVAVYTLDSNDWNNNSTLGLTMGYNCDLNGVCWFGT